MQATQTVSAPSAPAQSVVLQFPKALPAAPAAPEISQAQLGEVLYFRNELRRIGRLLEEAERDVQASLEAGAPIEPGVHAAGLKESFRRNVAWKDVAIRLADRLKLGGKAYCARVLASTKPARTISLDVR